MADRRSDSCLHERGEHRAGGAQRVSKSGASRATHGWTTFGTATRHEARGACLLLPFAGRLGMKVELSGSCVPALPTMSVGSGLRDRLLLDAGGVRPYGTGA